MKKYSLLVLAFLFLQSVFAQTFSDSNLPIALITTDIDPNTGSHYPIEGSEKTYGYLKIIFHPDGSRNSLADQYNPAFLNYNGRMAIRVRGQSTQALPKKQFRLDTYESDNTSNNNVSLLGMPEENDWILNGLGFDPLMIRDRISYDISRNMGNFAARGVYCELMINGVYQGVYMLSENIKRDTDRLNIAEILPTENTQPAITGGYITKCDKLSEGDYVAWSYDTHIGGWVDFVHDTPEPGEITTQQHNYIKSVFDGLKNTTAAQNTSTSNGFPSIIDIASFVDFILVNEFAANVDAYQYSTFFHKDRGGKLRAGPVWDFNLTYGNDLFVWGFDRSHYWVWQFDNWDNVGAKFWKQLYDNPQFHCYLAQRWAELTKPGQCFHYNTVSEKIDSLVQLLAEARPREQQKWGMIGSEQVYGSNILAMKTWIQNRITWMNEQIGTGTGCGFPQIQPIVISKIHYNPKASSPYSSNDLEFIELTNHSPNIVNLSGYYLSEPGMSFIFPSGSILQPAQKVYLAFNSSAFKQVYGIVPIGQYTRNMSNKTLKLVLRDPWGNLIDRVTYMDSAPWPEEADGDGPYLVLNDLDLDNALASNWTISTDPLVSTDLAIESYVTIFPNPFNSTLRISNSSGQLLQLDVLNVLGQKVVELPAIGESAMTVTLDFLSNGIYFARLYHEGKTILMEKLVKN
ncbi:MAG TPA: secretion system protein Por [Saprospirales bacterium]|nr:secretion system protein Por [Saprospirales bacterium]HRQ30178.1 CotH kinase family protein [Saprospiraceae bacterium]